MNTAKYTRKFKWPSNIYILEPTLSTTSGLSKETLLSNEYGKSEANNILRNILLSECHITNAHVLPITLANARSQIHDLTTRAEDIVIFNLCDGCEFDGYPGLSIIKLLTQSGLPFTGSDSYFYEGTTSKPVLKRMLMNARVETSEFVELFSDSLEENIAEAEKLIGWPMIVKPSVSYASLSISDSSIVSNAQEIQQEFQRVSLITQHGIFVERFLAGREFTVLCTGDRIDGVKVYPAVERVFDSNLKQRERILAFDRYWNGYELPDTKNLTTRVETTENSDKGEKAAMLYKYALAEDESQLKLQDLAERAYVACGGSGYGRVDIRTDSTKSINGVVLEVNANCGLTFQEETSSAAEIFRLSGVSAEDFCTYMISYAIRRNQRENL